MPTMSGMQVSTFHGVKIYNLSSGESTIVYPLDCLCPCLCYLQRRLYIPSTHRLPLADADFDRVCLSLCLAVSLSLTPCHCLPPSTCLARSRSSAGKVGKGKMYPHLSVNIITFCHQYKYPKVIIFTDKSAS